MHETLNHLARCIQQHLLEILPDLDEDWWGKNVVNRLTFQQQRQVSEKNISALEQLDLASLLRVLDQNWQEIRAKTELPFEARNWLKEAQNIRNRWAHLPVGGLQPEDIYRDLDTISRLVGSIGADQDLIAGINDLRDEALSKISQQSEHSSMIREELSAGTIAKGDVVQLKARPDQTGAVIDILEGDETRYVVFHNNAASTYYESQIEPILVEKKIQEVTPAWLHACLTATQLRPNGWSMLRKQPGEAPASSWRTN